MENKPKKVCIKRSDLIKLIFWASVGLRKARGGSNDNATIDVIFRLNKKYKMRFPKPTIGEWIRPHE